MENNMSTVQSQQASADVTDQVPTQPPITSQLEKKRNLLIPLLIIIALILTGVGLLTILLSKTFPAKLLTIITPTPQVKVLGASLVLFEGEVEYKKGNDGWKTPAVDTVLAKGDSIRVLSTGRAVINFDDGSIIRLNTNSLVTLVNITPERIEVTNEKGEVYSRVVKSKRTFLVNAGEIKYQSLGTAYTTLNTESEKGVEVYKSKVKVLEGKNEIVVNEGSKYTLEAKKVVTIVLADLKKDKFAKWNKQEDEKVSEFKGELGILANIEVSPTMATTPTTSAANSFGLTLNAVRVENGIKFNWSVGNVSVPSGFKIVRSESTNPVYPGNDYQYLSESSTREYTWSIKDGKTYHFRICTYVDGKCGVYSNDIVVTAPLGSVGESERKVNSLTIKSDGGNNVSWTVDGYSKLGYKIVFSKNSDPTYPTRDGDKYIYISNPDEKNTSVDTFSGSGTYHVRVCEYLGEACGLYSNQIEINL
jgi:hypothetical protein